MNKENNIDKLFREGSQREYTYDENLWAQLESQLPDINEDNIKKISGRNTFKLLLILPMIIFLETDSVVSLNQENLQQNEVLSGYSSSATIDGEEELSAEGPVAIETTEIKSNDERSQMQPWKNSSKTSGMVWLPFSLPLEETNMISVNDNVASHAVQKKTGVSDPTHSDPAEEISVLMGVEDDNFNQKARLKSSELSNSIHKEEDIGLTTNELDRINSRGFQKQTVIPEPGLLPNKKYKLNALQQNFKDREYYIEIGFGHSLWLNKELSGLDRSQKEYRSKAESSRFQQSMGVNILTDVKSFVVGLGIHMSSFHEKLIYSYNEEISSIKVSYDTSYTLVNDNFNSNGTSVILIRENIQENRTEMTGNANRELMINNRFKRISLPISLGYAKSFGRFSAGLRTALNINYLYSSSGGYIGSNRSHFYDFEEKQQLKEWTIGNKNQIRFAYSLNESVILGTSFYNEQDLSSFTQNYNSRFNSYGLGFWLLFRPK